MCSLFKEEFGWDSSRQTDNSYKFVVCRLNSWVAHKQIRATFVLEEAAADHSHLCVGGTVAVAGRRHADCSYLRVGVSSSR